MRGVLLGVMGVLAAGAAARAETSSFTTVLNGGLWRQQTLLHCREPARMNGRVPERCTLSERATAYPTSKIPRTFDLGVACAAGYSIVFFPNGTLAYCKLDGDQAFATHDATGYAVCSGYVTFDKDGVADCDP